MKDSNLHQNRVYNIWEVHTRMMKSGVTIEKKDNKISFYSCSEKYGRNYLYTKAFTLGEYKYFSRDRSMQELRSFHDWGKNPRLDKTIKRVIRMYQYVEKELEMAEAYELKDYSYYSCKLDPKEYCR